jgi:hypothetical protein
LPEDRVLHPVIDWLVVSLAYVDDCFRSERCEERFGLDGLPGRRVNQGKWR